MRRRGGFGMLGRWLRRPGFPGGPIRPVARPILRRLRRAHRLIAEGVYAEGAAELETIADIATTRNTPRAALLTVEAGLAWIMAGEWKRGLDLAHRGLSSARQAGDEARLAILRDRVVDTLRKAGHSAEADATLRMFATQSEAPVGVRPRTDLPTQCPQCGGSVRPDQVEWIDEATAACDYCGSVLKAGTI
ncbi:MAG TPA: hypothetical protein VFI11_01920 [Anaerolineales bacterium]|nr:hypothetical protein [Anaerolineales bacterium]